MMPDIFWFASIISLIFTVFIVTGPKAWSIKIFSTIGNFIHKTLSWVKGLFSRR